LKLFGGEFVAIDSSKFNSPFGTLKRGFDQGYMLTRGIEKVGTNAFHTVWR